jgi:hypothetical protein
VENFAFPFSLSPSWHRNPGKNILGVGNALLDRLPIKDSSGGRFGRGEGWLYLKPRRTKSLQIPPPTKDGGESPSLGDHFTFCNMISPWFTVGI